jgi:hypothetical protein
LSYIFSLICSSLLFSLFCLLSFSLEKILQIIDSSGIDLTSTLQSSVKAFHKSDLILSVTSFVVHFVHFHQLSFQNIGEVSMANNHNDSYHIYLSSWSSRFNVIGSHIVLHITCQIHLAIVLRVAFVTSPTIGKLDIHSNANVARGNAVSATQYTHASRLLAIVVLQIQKDGLTWLKLRLNSRRMELMALCMATKNFHRF